MTAHRRPRPRRLRRVLELERRRRAARRRGPSRHRLRQPAALGRRRRGRADRAGPHDRRADRARRPLLRRGRHHQRAGGRRRDRRPGLRRGLRAGGRRERRRRRRLRPGGTLGETLQPVPLPGGGVDLYIQQDKYHAAVLRRPPRAPGPADGDHAAADRRGRAGRGLGRRRRCGRRSRAGSSSASWTATSRPARTAAWPSGPAPGAPSRSPARRTSSACRTPRRPPS